MEIRVFGCAALAGLMVAGAGCKKSPPGEGDATSRKTQPAAQPTAATPATVARLHWLGMKTVGADTNGAIFHQVWALPETTRLKAQTLDKLALALTGAPAPEPPPATNGAIIAPPSTNIVLTPAASQLRPLLDDIVDNEAWLEIRGAAQGPGETVLALRLDDARSAAWEKNLADVLKAGGGAQTAEPAPHSWSVKRSAAPAFVQFQRAGDWTLVGLAPDKNALLTEVAGRIQKDKTPCVAIAPSATASQWLQVQADLPRACAALGCPWPFPKDTPKISLAFSGAGTNVHTTGKLEFPSPLPFQVEPWRVPTNLVHDPLFSFTAIQGLKSWLSATAAWKQLQAGDAPNQVYFWAQSGSPFMDFMAALVPDASNAVAGLSESLPKIFNPILTNSHIGLLEKSTNFHGLSWSRVPLTLPFLKDEDLPEGKFIQAGMAVNALTNRPTPPGTLHDLLAGTNLVYFDRELTGPRIEAWMYLSQFGRLSFRRFQLPGDSASVNWLKTGGAFLQTASTTVARTGPAELRLDRTSSVGFTAPELHALADWLESPRFPRGMWTLLEKMPPPRAIPGRTNAAAPPPSLP